MGTILARGLEGKAALVTGGGSGIGRAIAECFAAEGASVLIADIDHERAQQTAVAIGAQAQAVECDVSNSSEVAAAVATAEEVLGGLDIMVNNAARAGASALVDVEDDHWARAMAVNLNGVFHGIKHAARAMAARDGGAILNVSSIAARRAIPGLAAYSTAKAGVEALTRAAAVELRPANIRVNALVPGMIHTESGELTAPVLERGLGTTIDRYLDQRQGRWGRPNEVARAALHLVGAESSFTSGLLYVIDNANTAS